MESRRKKSSFKGKVLKDAKKSLRTSKSYLKLPEGVKSFMIDEKQKTIMIDILPYVVSDKHHPNRDEEFEIAIKGDLWWRRPFKVHRNVGSHNESCVCPQSIGLKCPICEYQQELFDQDKRKDAIALYPTDRNLYNVIPLDSKFHDEEIYVWDMSEKLFQEILKDKLEEDDSHEIFPDLENGETLEVSFKWKKLGKNTFPEARNIIFHERDEAYDESILNDVVDLDKILIVLPYDELANKFFEKDEEDGGKLQDIDEDDEDEDEDEAPRKKKSLHKKPSPKRSRKVEYDDEEDDEEDEPPRKSKKVGKKKTEMECPNDHIFAEDFDEYDDCSDCDLYDACYEANKKL